VITEDKVVAGEQCKFYNASSPDELALVNGMRHFGFAFMERDIDDNIVVDHDGTIKKYKLLHVIEFNSDRKRMSVVVRDADGRVLIVCKGADSIINARLRSDQPHVEETNR
jgi:magnesium-transporting ATPase (P-type)